MSYDDVSIRALVSQFRHPMVATHGATIVAANDAYLELVGRTREELEGQSVERVLAPEDEQRIVERARSWLERHALHTFSPSAAVLLLRGDGQRVRVVAQSSVFPAGQGKLDYLVSSCWRTDSEELVIGEQLGAIAGDVLEAQTESEVRSLAAVGLKKMGLSGAFVEKGEGGWRCTEPAELAVREEYASRALELQRIVFEGGTTSESAPVQAYLPLSAPDRAMVLVVEGLGLSPLWAPSLMLFARQLSSAQYNARLIADLRRSNAETGLLLDLARTTSATLELETILDVAGDFLVKLLDVSNCFFLLVDSAQRALLGAASSLRHRAFFRTVRISVDDEQSFAARVFRECRPLWVEDLRSQPAQADPARVSRFGERALLGLPLMSRDQAIGVVVMDDTRGPRDFTGHTLELARAMVGQLSLSVANAQLYHSLRESYAQLEATRAQMVKTERLAALGELSAIVAHEVRNPLGVVFNAVSSLRRLLREPSFRPAEAEVLLHLVEEESERLNRMVGELLDFSRPRELALYPEPMAEVVEEAIDAVKQGGELDPAVPIGFSFHCVAGMAPLRMDRRQVRQALVNVLANAAQAMPRGGTVRVEARAEIRHERAGIRVDIADQGVGLPKEVQARIFQPFFTTKARGTGLGLAVVKRIVDDHQGEVVVYSRLEAGTTVTLWFGPLAA